MMCGYEGANGLHRDRRVFPRDDCTTRAPSASDEYTGSSTLGGERRGDKDERGNRELDGAGDCK
jgi:hypothetical protein